MKNNNGSIELLSIHVDETNKINRGECWFFDVAQQFPLRSLSQYSGKSTIEVGPPHNGYVIHTFVNNGKLYGKSKILNPDGVIVAKLYFDEGIATGPCTLYDELGRLYFKGRLENGYRKGRGQEYDEDGDMIFDGFFEKGQRMNLYPSKERFGFVEEYDENGNVIRISERNDNGEIHGKCYLYSKEGKIKKISKWKNGKEINVFAKFSGDKMYEYRNGVKRYEGGYREISKTVYVREGEGILYKRDGERKRYEGSFHNGLRHGRGSYFDCMELKHTRHWTNGFQRIWWYIGLLYLIVAYSLFYTWLFKIYAAQSIIHAIVFIVLIVPLITILILIPFIICLIIALRDNDFRYYSIFYYTKKKQISVNHYWGLSIQSFVPPQYDFESITIGNRCFIKAILFHINGLKQLKQLKIGNKSFSTKVSCCHKIGYSFHILNCPLLQSIEIGERSFYDYYGQFELSNLPALQSISIGSLNNDSSNFVYSSFVIQSTSFISFHSLYHRSTSTSTHCFGQNGFQSIIYNHY